MREIKFRAWDEEEKRMLDGDYIEESESCVPFLIDGVLGIARTDTDWRELIVMQFTGLTDKNGVGVYEGDIIKTNWQNKKGVVVFTLGSFMMEENFEQTALQALFRNIWAIEVIGNIYEHPHLMKK